MSTKIRGSVQALILIAQIFLISGLHAIESSEIKNSPYSKYVRKEKIRKIIGDLPPAENPLNEKMGKFQKAQALTIDTRDQDSCLQIKRTFLEKVEVISDNLDSLCDQDFEKPYATIVYTNRVDLSPNDFESFNAKERELIRQTRNMSVLGAGVMGALYALPTSVTNWHKSTIGSEGHTYFDNVRNGPVMDSDPWYINLVGHPYAGAVYYRVARHAGYGKLQSFGYSVMMSTLFWEYGMEALVEVPSIQDLIFTPLLGAVLGETFIYLEEKIKENDGKLLGSKLLGTIAMTLMNPGKLLLEQANKLFENDFIEESQFFLYSGPMRGSNLRMPYPLDDFDGPYNQLGIGFEIKF